MNVRPFNPSDAEFCFNLRSNAFKQKFCGELTPQDTTAAINAYLPEVYIRMAQETPIFIVEQRETPVGFFTLKRRDSSTAELPQIYLDLDRLGKGIGRIRRCWAWKRQPNFLSNLCVSLIHRNFSS
jgi:hypothetical protein